MRGAAASSVVLRVVGVAVASRVLTALLAVAVSGFPDFDTSAPAGSSFFALFARWDGVYFSRIALAGYEYEHYHAFFPLYPCLVAVVSRVAHVDVLASGFALSNVCFVLSAVVFHAVSAAVLRSDRLAWAATVLYCFTPASIFMSALYTESLFALLSLLGIASLLLLRRPWLATLAFSLATATRSNGFLLCGFLLYDAVDEFIDIRDVLVLFKRPKLRSSTAKPMRAMLLSAAATALRCLIVCTPYIAVQVHGAKTFCHLPGHSPVANLELCRSNFYMYIQAEYWNQGLFRYWRWKQLPNFLLAGPTFVLAFSCAVDFWRSKGSSAMLVFVAYLAGSAAIALVGMHVQVVTRFVSASPALYWHCSNLIARGSKTTQSLVIFFFIAYFLLGPLLFVNFYPWT
jgi:phosphatidylinositol glycan class V